MISSQTIRLTNLKKILIIVFMLFLYLFFSSQSHAAIVVHTTSQSTQTTGVLTVGTALTLSNYTVSAGTGRLLLVGVSWQNRNEGAVATVTYGAQPLTLVATQFTGDSSRVEIWSLKENLIAMVSSPADIAVTFDDDIDRGAGFGAVSFSGVDQTQPYHSVTSSTGNSENLSLPVTSATGELVFAIASQEEEVDPLVPDASLSEHWNFIAINGNRESLGAGATKAGAATVDMDWTNPNNGNDWAMVGLSIQPPQPPKIITTHANCPNLNQVTIVFSSDINTGTTGAGGGNPSNYSLSGGASVTSAVVSGNKVTLTTSSLLPTTAYTLTVNNVEDLTGNPVATNTTSDFTSPDCTGLVGSCVTYKDTFSFSSYDNNDSDAGLSWLSDWSEVGDDASPVGGDIQIVNGEVFYNGGNTQSIERSVDLSNYDYASLKFDYTTIGNWDATDGTSVYISNTLVAPSPYLNDHASTKTLDITSLISSNTILKLELDSSFNNTENATIDNVQIMACAGPPTISSSAAACPALNQITVTFSKDIEIASAPATFTLTGGLGTPPTIIGQTASGNSVTLTTSVPLATLTAYTLTVNGVKDLVGNTIAANSTSMFTTSDCTELVAQYRFDEETWDLTAGQVISQTGNFNGTRIGSAAPIYPGQVCNAAYIPANVILADSNAIDTNIDPNTDLGDSAGSINFWYQSDTNWVGGGDRILLDASDDTTGTNIDKYFFLLITNNGTLRFGFEDNADGDYAVETGVYTKTANDWVHIGITWDLPNDEFIIYIDGAVAATDNSNTNGTLGDVKSIYLGDNRSTYVLLGTQNSAGGRIDEAYIYNIVIDGNQMMTDMNSTHTCTAIACSYRDDFTVASFANDDGSIPWLADWTETDEDITGATAGYVSITGGSLLLQNNTPAVSATIPKIVRDFSLSGVTSASIYYTFKLTGNVDAADEAIITMFDGTETTTIETITGLTNGTYSRNFSIPAAMLGENNIQLSIGINGAGQYTGGSETISFLYLAIYPDNICSINTLHHLQISHDGAGLTCEPENIKIKACADPSCVLSYTSPVTITTSPTTAPTVWIPANPIVIPADTEATVQLSHKTLTPAGVPQTLTLDITTSNPAPADNAVACKDLLGNTLPNCNITFYDSGFVFTMPAQVSCETSTTPIKIRAVRKDTETEQCVSLFDSAVTKTINFAISPAPTPDIIMNQGQTNESTFTSTAANQNVDLSFTNGESTFTLAHNNAGQFTLDASHLLDGLTVNGTTPFVVRPHSFFLQGYYDEVAETPLNNAAASGDPKWKASDNFRLRLRGQCQNGTITTNYIPTNAEIQVELALPVAGTNNNFTLQGTDYLSTATATPTWYNVSSKFTNGAVTNGGNDYADAAFHEVGVVNLHVRDTDYFGATIAEQTQTVGRFTPHHFDTTITPGCNAGVNPYTYSGQAFNVVATARNNISPTATTTQNYSGAFAYDTTLTNAAVADIANFNGTNIIPKASFQSGNNSLAAKSVTYTYPIKETVAADITLRANDADTATATGLVEDKTNIRSGRMILENVFGPVSADLTMLISSEYYYDNATPADTSDDYFIFNADDTCSSYDAAGGSLVNYTDNLTNGDTSVSGAGTLTAGEGFITFTSPGNGNDGKVNLLLNNFDSWLTYNAGIDCDNADADNNINTGTDEGACGTASFGIYRGDDRIIYWREIF